MNKRQSMKGMGADAFFASPNQQDSKPVERQGDSPAKRSGEDTGKLVKATFYLTPEQVLKLEQLRLDRLKKGQRIDKSALVREAIDQLNS